MKNLSDTFKKFAESQEKLASNPRTLAFAFGLAAVCYPFSISAATGAAIAPTLLAGSALISRGISKVTKALNPAA